MAMHDFLVLIGHLLPILFFLTFWMIMANLVIVPATSISQPRMQCRKNGDIDHAPDSRLPYFVDYNNAMEKIKVATGNGHKSICMQTSAAVQEELQRDGYLVRCRKQDALGHNMDIISWN